MNIPAIFRRTPAPLPAVRIEPVASLVAPVKADGRMSRVRRQVSGAVRMIFGSAEVTRLTGDWGTAPQSADWIINRHQRTLVARSREQLFNNDYFKAYARLCRQNIVGPTGLVFQSKARTAGGKIDKKAKAGVERSLKDWSKRENCDVAGKLSWRGIQLHCVNSAVTDGEFLLRKITGKDAGKYGFQLQVIDPVRCPVDYDRSAIGDGGNFIRHGIEFNKYGRAVAYHIQAGNGSRGVDAYTYGGRTYVRVPADEMIHGFLPEIAGQKRGLPWLSTGLFRLKQMGAFEDAAVVNARVGANKLGVIEYAEGEGPECNEPGEDDVGENLVGEAGEFLTLPNGAKLNKFEPTYPSGEFAIFMKAMLRSIAAGGGVSYHNLAQDLEGVNFSSIRQGTLDEREHFKELQEWLIDELAEPVHAAWFDSAILRGAILRDDGVALPASKADLFADHQFQGRRWEWIDPNADMKAAEGRKNNLLASPSELIRETGRDPAVVIQEIADDIKMMQAAGIPEEFIKLAMGMKLSEAPAPKPPEGNAGNE